MRAVLTLLVRDKADIIRSNHRRYSRRSGSIGPRHVGARAACGLLTIPLGNSERYADEQNLW